MTEQEPPQGVHLVGSIPLAGSEQVFRDVGGALGDHVSRVPDGETGERLTWVRWLLPLLDSHPALQRVEGIMPYPLYGLREGVDVADVGFGELGYAREALASYEVFARLKREAVLPPHVRFQVGLPAAFDVCCVFLPDLIQALRPAVAAALANEVATIAEQIPHRELAIQWEVCMEFAVLENLVPLPIGLDDLVAWVADDAAGVPDDVEVGFHLCYGDYEHSHFVEPTDTDLLVQLANAIARALRRDIGWFHLPVPRDRDDDQYFEPLQRLQTGASTEVHLGLVHHTDGLEGSARRLETARRHLSRFGIATECGMGRRAPETIPELLALHARLCETA
ncbi:MAG: hypothetical protein GEV09_06805 [Pseudonocardiaceae bacterium]|nr:hypothetical protein [Pseudonocardiaceae bacterium]